MAIENLTVIGDVAPDGRSMLSDFDLDLLGATRSFTFDMLPQGVYSRITFRIDAIHAQGSWRGVPLTIQIEPEDGTPSNVDLRSSSGVELTAGHDATLTVRVDAGSWFAGDVLDSAAQSSSQIVDRRLQQYRHRLAAPLERHRVVRAERLAHPIVPASRRRRQGVCTRIELLWQLLQAPLPLTLLTIGVVAGQSEASTLMGKVSGSRSRSFRCWR